LPQDRSQPPQAPSRLDAPVSGVLLLIEDDLDHAFLVQRQLRDRADLDLQVVHVGTVADATQRLRAATSAA